MELMSKGVKTDWSCRVTWLKAAYNTGWSLLGCSIGDFGTIAFFQLAEILWSPLLIMSLAVVNGLITSIILEVFVLRRHMGFKLALETAFGMSMISMIAMEISMNAIDLILTGGAELNWWIIPIMLCAGFCTPLPYNYWRLKTKGKSCH